MLVLVSLIAWSATAAVAAQETGTDSGAGVAVQEGLKDGFESGSNETVDVILRLGELRVDKPVGVTRSETRRTVVSRMKTAAESRQKPVIDRLGGIDGAEVKNSFWMGNAVHTSVDTSRVSLNDLKRLPGVVRIHKNHRVEGLSVDSGIGTAQLAPTNHTTEPYSWALEQVNVPDINREFGSLLKDNDTRVAVLDTGIDPDHPDLTVGGWAEFDDDGNKVNSNPNDCGIHGTHVSGTVAGNGSINKDDYGLYGVAPDTVELYHGGVLTEESTDGCFTGSFSSVTAGMQWAVDNNADIISMSLGANGTDNGYIQHVQQAQNAGSAVIASIGNDGEGASGSPGNVYDSISVGASTRGEYIASFSSGEVIDTDKAWNPDNDSRIEDWPSSYTVPSVSAPGRGIYSSVNDSGYKGLQGTSMATPHVSGASALVMSVDPNDDMTPDELEGLLRNTSWKPDDTTLEAEFSVGIDGTNSPVNEGDILRVDYNFTVSNEAETGLVGLGIFDQNGNTVEQVADSTYRTIKPGDVATGTLTWDTTGQTDGTYIAGVGVVNATGNIDGSASRFFEIGSGSTSSITTADVSGADFTFSTAQSEPDTRYGKGIIDPYAAIVKEFVDGNVSETNVQGGTYEAGETVNATTTLNNTGDIQNEFFVQHEVRGSDGVWRDSGGNDGSSVTLNSGENTGVEASWEVEAGAPGGEYDSRITAWVEQDYEHRENAADSVLVENAFSVSKKAKEVSCGRINEPGLYELQSNVSSSSTCVEITASNVTFDGNGHSIEGGSGRGIFVHGPVSDVTIKNVETRNWGRGVFLEDASRVDVLNISSQSNNDAVRLSSSDNNNIRDSNISNSGAGIRLVKNSIGNRITNNTIEGNTDGVNVRSSDQNTVKNNVISNNNGVGVRLWDSSEEGEIVGNLMDSNGIGTLFQKPPSGQTTDSKIIDNRIFNSDIVGISLNTTIESEIRNNTVESTNSLSGIGLLDSYNNTVRNNTAKSNNGSGIALLNSSENIVRRNTVESNEIAGIGTARDSKSNRNLIENNTANSNGWIGIGMAGSNNTIENNTVYNNAEYGIGLGTLPSNNNEVIRNDLQHNEIGLGLNASSEDNVAIDNTIENNTEAIITEEGAQILIEGTGGGTETQTVSTFETTQDQTTVGTLNQEKRENAITNNSAENSDVAFRTSKGAATVIERLDIGESSKPDTVVSLEGENVSVRSVSNPPKNLDATSIGRYFNATEETSDSFLNAEVHYKKDDIEGINESSLSIWKYNGTEWRKIDSTVNTVENVVNTSVTEFSTFGVFAEEEAKDPAFFNVTITSVDSAVTEGETITAAYQVKNTGGVADTQDITFAVNGTTEDTEPSLTLNSSETFSGQFTYATSASDVPQVTTGVSSENDSATETVTVNEASVDNVSITPTSTTVTAGVVGAEDFSAEAVDQYGNTITSSDGDFSWTASAGSVDSTGVYDAPTSAGTDTVTVEYNGVTASATVTVNEQSSFEVTITNVDSAVTGGETITVAYEVTNTGNLQDTQDIEFAVNGTTEDTESGLTLNGSETFAGQFTYATDGGDTPELALDVASADDVASATVAVEEPAFFTVSINATTAPVVEGENLSVNAHVQNTGDASGTQTVTLNMGTLGTESASVSLAGGASTTENFSVVTGTGDAGEYTAMVSSENDTDNTTVTVEAPPTSSLSDLSIAGQGTDATITEGDNESVAVNATNIGDKAGSFDVTLEVGSSVTETQTTSTLSAGDTELVIFKNATGGLSVGDYDVDVTTGNDTATGNITAEQPSTSELSGLNIAGQGADATITEGDNETVAVNVTNAGDQSGNFDVTLEIGTAVTETRTTSVLGASEAETVRFENITGGLSAGDYELNVTTDSDTVSGTLTVEQPAKSDLADIDIAGQGADATITEGTDEDVSVTVENVGDQAGSFGVKLWIGTAEQRNTSTDELAPGDNRTVRFENATGSLNPGDYGVNVSTPDDEVNGSLTVREPANFAVNITGTNSPVAEGETLTVEAQIENRGDENGSQTVTLDAGALGNDSTEVPLDGGDSTTETLSVGTGAGDAGEYTANVSSEDDTDSKNVTVNESARFSVSIDTTNSPVVEGESLAIVANIENTGDEPDTQTVAVDAGALGANSTEVSLGGGNSTTETLSVGTGTGDAGEYTANVSSEDDTDNTSVTVTEPVANLTVELDPVGDLDGETTVWVNGTVSEEDGVETDGMTVDAVVTNESTEASVAQRNVTVGDSDDSGDELTELDGNQTTVAFDFGTLEAGTVDGGDDYTVTVTADAENANQTADTDGFNVSEVQESAFFEVRDLTAPGTVEQGEVFGVNATVENTGDVEDTQDIELRFDGDLKASRNEGLAGGENVTVEFGNLSVGEAGEVGVRVASENDNATATVTVEKPPETAFFDVNLTRTNQPVTEGETLEVTANVTNTGDRSDTQNVTLRDTGFGDMERDSVNVTLSGGESNGSVTLTWETEVGLNGTGNATVSTENASDRKEVTVQEQTDPAFFEVDIKETNSPIEEGEVLGVTAEVTNTGDENDTQNTSLELDADAVSTDSVTDYVSVSLDGGNTTTETFEWETVKGDAGEYNATVASEDDADSTSVKVEESLEPAFFEVGITETNSPVAEGEMLEVKANVTNTGDENATQTVSVDAGALGTNSTGVSLAGGESATEKLSVGTGAGDAGEYNATVASEDDTDNTSVTVQAANLAVNITGTNSPVVEGERLRVNVTVENTGGVRVARTVSLTDFDGEVVDDRNVQLDGGSESVFELAWDTAVGENGTGEVTVSTDNDTDTANATVLEEAFFAVDSLQPADAEIGSNETLNVSAEVTNLGGESASTEVEMLIDGEPLENRTTDILNEGQSEVVEFEVGQSLEAGEYVHSVATPDQNATGNLTVTPSKLFTEPLVDRFGAPPTNTGRFDDALYEDLSGDGDGKGVTQTVAVFGELIRGNDLNGDAPDGGLTDEQARALNWNAGSPETEVTPADMVSLFGKQIRA